MREENVVSAKNGGYVYTTGLDRGIPIGYLKRVDDRMVLEVKHHKKEDTIDVEELVEILVEYQGNNCI